MGRADVVRLVRYHNGPIILQGMQPDMTIAKEIMKYARWEPGMLPASTMGPSERLQGHDAPLHCTAACLDDRQTVDVLFGQLRVRFAAMGWALRVVRVNQTAGASALPAALSEFDGPGVGWKDYGPEGEVLLRGFRKVSELESEATQ